jgi:SAM-dependent methyltransferase
VEHPNADAFNAFEAAGWNEAALGYHDFFQAITPRVVEPLLDAVAAGGGTRLLDVATGPGYVAAAADERGATVVGADLSPAMVQIARRLQPELEFVEADAEGLPFPDESFDAITGNFVVLHLGRPERAAAQFARVLRPGGRVALTTWDAPSRSRMPGVFVDAFQQAGATPPDDVPEGPPLFRFADEAEFAKLLEDAGLTDVDVDQVSFTMTVPDAQALWEGALGGAVRMRGLILGQSDEMQARIRAAFDEIAGAYDNGSGLEVPVSVRLASGRKPPT